MSGLVVRVLGLSGLDDSVRVLGLRGLDDGGSFSRVLRVVSRRSDDGVLDGGVLVVLRSGHLGIEFEFSDVIVEVSRVSVPEFGRDVGVGVFSFEVDSFVG